MEYQDDDDDDSYDAVYENGRWVWDDVTRQLVYKKYVTVFDFVYCVCFVSV